MRHIKQFFAMMFLLFGSLLQAQETIVATGGQVTGSGGSSSYTVGQTVYTTVSGTGDSTNQGVEQAYYIEVTTGAALAEVTLAINAYPQPYYK